MPWSEPTCGPHAPGRLWPMHGSAHSKDGHVHLQSLNPVDYLYFEFLAGCYNFSSFNTWAYFSALLEIILLIMAFIFELFVILLLLKSNYKKN